MKIERAIVVAAAGTFGSGGLGARHAAFGHLAQQTRIHVERSRWDLDGQRVAALPDALLPTLHPTLHALGTYADHDSRMLCMADHALREAADGPAQTRGALPLFMAAPHPMRACTWLQDAATLCAHLQVQTGVALDADRSAMFRHGRAGAFFALVAATDYLRQHGGQVYVGGVDSYFESGILAALRRDRRLSSDGPGEGFVPGEGAACVRLAWRPAAPGDVVLVATGLGPKAERRDGDAADAAAGLSDALAAMHQGGAHGAARTVFAGLTGESFGAKAWQVARLRQASRFTADARIETPVESTGCLGAALGIHLLAVAATCLRHGLLPGPAASWAASDAGDAGAATLALHRPQQEAA